MTTFARDRTVARVTTRRRLGPDAQVDDKALVIDPTEPSLSDPFLVLSEDWFSTPGFEWHPHRGLETVTTVLDGVLEHGDNLGNTGALHSGDVQWMTAGRGIIHSEMPEQEAGRMAGLARLCIFTPILSDEQRPVGRAWPGAVDTPNPAERQ